MRGGSPAAETRPRCSPGACLQTLCFAAACRRAACLPNASSSVANRGMMRMSITQCPQRPLQLLPPPPAANSLGAGFPPAGTCSHAADQLARPPLLPDRPAPARLCAAASALQLHPGVSGGSVRQSASTSAAPCAAQCCRSCHLLNMLLLTVQSALFCPWLQSVHSCCGDCVCDHLEALRCAQPAAHALQSQVSPSKPCVQSTIAAAGSCSAATCWAALLSHPVTPSLHAACSPAQAPDRR